MTAPAETSSRSSTPASPDVAAIDVSCRWPVLTLYKGAAFWLVISSLFGLIASLKFHKPTLLADCAWFTYGRAYSVWTDALVYGFCVPSALAVALWLTTRLGRVKLCSPWVISAAAKLCTSACSSACAEFSAATARAMNGSTPALLDGDFAHCVSW